MFNRNKSASANERSARRQSSGNSRGRSVDGFDMAVYRRGTTLGSFSSDSTAETDRQRLKRLRNMRRRIIAVLLSITVVLIIGVAILVQFTGHIANIRAANNIQLSQSDKSIYTKLVDEYLAKNSSERLSFIRRNTALLQYLRDKAPEVESFSLTTAGLATSDLELNFRQPVAMWVNGGEISYVDKNGVVFDRNYFERPSISITDNSGIRLSGGVATSTKFLSFVGRVSVALKQKYNLIVEKVIIPPGSVRYVEFYLQGRSYPFKAQITRNALSQAADISVMARYLVQRSINPSYVDCRIEGKAYWK